MLYNSSLIPPKPSILTFDTYILESKIHGNNQIDDLNRQRNGIIKSKTWMTFQPHFKHSYRKGKWTTESVEGHWKHFVPWYSNKRMEY